MYSQLAHLPRSPHQHTPEFARGWRARHNRVPESRCPYPNDALASARWLDGHNAASTTLARGAADRPAKRAAGAG